MKTMMMHNRHNRIKRSTVRYVFIICNTIFMLLMAFVFVGPYINILAKALNSAKDTMLGGIGLWPRKWTWDNFNVVLGDPGTWSGLKITALRVVLGSLLSIFVIYAAAYVLLRKGLRFRKFIVTFLTLPMFISGGLISNYIIYAKLGIYNTFLVYILPGAFSFFNMVVIRTYLAGIPEALRESARIDGASEFVILLKIMLPLSMPIVATVLLWCAVAHWNDWTTTLYYILDSSLFTLQYNLQLAFKEAETVQNMIADAIATGRPLGDISTDISGESIQAAQIIVSTLPIVVVYPFLQRYFIHGVMIGSVKE